jgi:hypothetical protein
MVELVARDPQQLPSVCIEIRDRRDRALALEKSQVVDPPFRQTRVSGRSRSAGDIADLIVDAVDELFDQCGGRGRLLELNLAQSVLVVPIGEVRSGESAREQGGGDE